MYFFFLCFGLFHSGQEKGFEEVCTVYVCMYDALNNLRLLKLEINYAARSP